MFREVSADHSKAGFTLIEILIALSIFGIASAALITGLLANSSANNTVQQRAEAARIIEAQFETYRQTNDYGSLQAGSGERIVESTIIKNGVEYTVKATFCPADLPVITAEAMPCSPSAVYIRLEVENGSKKLQKAETYYTRFGSAV